MKKNLLSCFLFLILFPAFSENLPQNIYGIWEGKDRFIFFEKNQADENNQLVVCLKEYYGWYVDRTSEPEIYAQRQKRTRNSGTTRKALQIMIDTNKILKDNSVYEFTLSYSKSQNNNIPVYINEDNIYLDFYMQDSEYPMFYRGSAVSQGFLVSQQIVPENLICYVIDENKIFTLRYWKTDMNFSSDVAFFDWDEKKYTVPKHVLSCGNVYTCVNGRSSNIRNIQNPEEYNQNDYFFNSEKTVMILNNEPYLTKIANKSTFEDLMQIIATANSKRKPDPKPLFPPNDLNWHWDVIDLLEKDNKLIQDVRKRQLDFGPRGH